MTEAGFGRLSDPPATFVVTGARLIDPAGGTDESGDLGVADGRIVPAGSVPAEAERIDGTGLVVAPGLCDLHVHLRDPGDPAAETVESGARAAARGGFTTICAMPNTDPPLDDAEAVAALLGRAAGAACRVRAIAAATLGRAGREPADLARLAAAGAVAVSDDGAAIPDEPTARAVLSAARDAGLLLIEHAEDPRLAAGGVMRAGPTAARLGLAGWDPAAEVAIVERDIALAAELGARLHLTHLSTAAAVDAVRRARKAGTPVTCDVTPHHLALADSWVGGDRAFAWEEPRVDAAVAYDGACRLNPPLPSREDAAALRAALADGTIDAIATDHAPHPPERKLVPFAEAAPGLIGLETALSIGIALAEAGGTPLPTVIAALSTRPAAIIGERRDLRPGGLADLVVFDPIARWRVARGELVSRSANTPLLGMTLPGVVRLTVAEGRVTYRSG